MSAEPKKEPVPPRKATAESDSEDDDDLDDLDGERAVQLPSSLRN